MINSSHLSVRKSGDKLIEDHAQRQLQTFLDEIKNGTRNYRTIASLDEQISQAYRGRCILELLQNAHDALINVSNDDQKKIYFSLRSGDEPVLLVANSGNPFYEENFNGLCELGQSSKDPNECVGNKGLGFRSILEISSCPEIWSSAPINKNVAFAFKFTHSVFDKIESALRQFKNNGLGVESPFASGRLLVDWSEEQLHQFRDSTAKNNIDFAKEVNSYLSPYLFPLPSSENDPDVEYLLENGYVTVICLPINVGETKLQEEAVQSVREQLDKLDEKSMVFLPYVEKLIIDTDQGERTLERLSDSVSEITDSFSYRHERLLITQSCSSQGDHPIRVFRKWTCEIGGDSNPEQAKQIRNKVSHLPNQWPDVNRVTISVAVEETTDPGEGCFVIFLPTEMKTGTCAYINAPFYGTVDRRHIDFSIPYNDFLLTTTLTLIFDVVTRLTEESPQNNPSSAQAVIDLLSSTAAVDGQDYKLIDRLKQFAVESKRPLQELNLILCYEGWVKPATARLMPSIPEDASIGHEDWRNYATFSIVSNKLQERETAVKALIEDLEGSVFPTNSEWVQTLEMIAKSVKKEDIVATWHEFLKSVLVVLPENLRREPGSSEDDPLTSAKFIPDQNNRLHSASDSTKLFFQPVRGVDDAADLVENIPPILRNRVAFLHGSVETHHGPQSQNTSVQKFLEGRFVQAFRREELIRDVVLPALANLPNSKHSNTQKIYSELFPWIMTLVGDNPPDTLLPLLEKLPAACNGGWYPMNKAIFGPQWLDRQGSEIATLADNLPTIPAEELCKRFIRPPDDPSWGQDVHQFSEFFSKLGVSDGLRLVSADKVNVTSKNYEFSITSNKPEIIPQSNWDAWRASVNKEYEVQYSGYFEWQLSEIKWIPELNYFESLNSEGCTALSKILLLSLASWPEGWQSVQAKKIRGDGWTVSIISPLKFWLTEIGWLNDGEIQEPLNQRWLIPYSNVVRQAYRYEHLQPLSVELAHQLDSQPNLVSALKDFGLNIYPEEGERIGPSLLNALASAWETNNVPSGRFDAFLGQARDAWRRFDITQGLPRKFLVRTGRRNFSVCDKNQLSDVYLPDDRQRTKTLYRLVKPVLEMYANDAAKHGKELYEAVGVKLASSLEEKFLVDDICWSGMPEDWTMLESSTLKWLPVTLLSIAAYGGDNPTGSNTKGWHDACNKLRSTKVVECRTIVQQLLDGDDIVAESEFSAQWLPGNVLAVAFDIDSSYGVLEPAAQSLLDRQDIVKDLRLVLGALSGEANPDVMQIEKALESAEIDAQQIAEINSHWAGSVSHIADRIRPVLTLHDIPIDEIDAVATDIDSLTNWLHTLQLHWPVDDLLSTARQHLEDDYGMGLASWRALGEDAQLFKWRAVLKRLDYQCHNLKNSNAEQQFKEHLESIQLLLQCFARHVAIDSKNLELFHTIENGSKNLQVCPDWSTYWWEVPFKVVMDVLCRGYAKVLDRQDSHLQMFQRANSPEELHEEFRINGIDAEHSPYDIARRNAEELQNTIAALFDLYRVWVELNGAADFLFEQPKPPSELEIEAYLHYWCSRELLDQALKIIGDQKFIDSCKDCGDLDQIRKKLDLTEDRVESKRQERQEHERDKERQARTFDAAGIDFEVGVSRYEDLFKHIVNGDLPDPVGPKASKDEYTNLDNPPVSGTSPKGPNPILGGSRPKSQNDFLEFVGVVGEIHVYRFLRQEFDNAISADSWVSETRKRVLPLVHGETDKTNDGLGFDFTFRHKRKTWNVEVKATSGTDTQFDLGISEIEAATRLARKRGGRWRVLRVSEALSNSPRFDWLPNPFEEGFKQKYRLHKGGMRVAFKRQKGKNA